MVESVKLHIVILQIKMFSLDTLFFIVLWDSSFSPIPSSYSHFISHYFVGQESHLLTPHYLVGLPSSFLFSLIPSYFSLITKPLLLRISYYHLMISSYKTLISSYSFLIYPLSFLMIKNRIPFIFLMIP